MTKYIPDIGDKFVFKGKTCIIEDVFDAGDAFEVPCYYSKDVGYGLTIDKILPMIWEAEHANT